jgi:NAD(P)-dependent dehydrogenase (short-subunit alcohol dehydrogenase family)
VLTSARAKVAARELVGFVEKTFRDSGLDILVHNVGGPKPTDTAQTSAEDWQAGFEQLFQSVAELNCAFLPGMKERNFRRSSLCHLAVCDGTYSADLAISNSLRAAVTAMLKGFGQRGGSTQYHRQLCGPRCHRHR